MSILELKSRFTLKLNESKRGLDSGLLTVQDPVTGKTTYRDEKDGLTYEWDEAKKAWFPALNEDFMAMYQLNYGFTK